MINVQIAIPDDWLRQLEEIASEEQTTVPELLYEAVENFLNDDAEQES